MSSIPPGKHFDIKVKFGSTTMRLELSYDASETELKGSRSSTETIVEDEFTRIELHVYLTQGDNKPTEMKSIPIIMAPKGEDWDCIISPCIEEEGKEYVIHVIGKIDYLKTQNWRSGNACTQEFNIAA